MFGMGHAIQSRRLRRPPWQQSFEKASYGGGAQKPVMPVSRWNCREKARVAAAETNA